MFMHWMLPATDRCFTGRTESRPGTIAAAADVVDDGENYELVLEMPGVAQENLSLALEERTLVVRGTRNGYSDEQHVLYDGRRAGHTLEGRFSIGEDVDRSRVRARLENGLLRVTLPRKAEEKRKRIEVEVK